MGISMINWIKIGAAALIVAMISGMSIYIKIQASKIETLDAKLKSSEVVNKTLNQTIISQNESIAISNAKYEEVQKQLDKASGMNVVIRKEFDKIKKEINKKPIPQTCEEANKELIETGKVLGEKWKK